VNSPSDTNSAFTLWHRDTDGPGLLLISQQPGQPAEQIEMDVRDLPRHPEILCRLGEKTQARLLYDAAECSRGNFALNPEFGDIPELPTAAEPYKAITE
jgi:hypothetical protein